MRFTIRDLLWLTVVVALGAAWRVDRSQLAEVTNLVDAVRAYHHGSGDYPPNPPASSRNQPSD